jgi:hypothetical protein
MSAPESFNLLSGMAAAHPDHHCTRQDRVWEPTEASKSNSRESRYFLRFDRLPLTTPAQWRNDLPEKHDSYRDLKRFVLECFDGVLRGCAPLRPRGAPGDRVRYDG